MIIHFVSMKAEQNFKISVSGQYTGPKFELSTCQDKSNAEKEIAPFDKGIKDRIEFQSGSGTIEDPYLVTSPSQLNEVRNYPDKHFRQTADINLDTIPWNQGACWLPIGEFNNEFSGSYDGYGHVISNLFINRPGSTFMGLFGCIKGAIIKNLTFLDPDVTGSQMIGALVGYASHNSYIMYIRVINADIKLLQRYAGGMAGAFNDASAYRCYSTGTVSNGPISTWNTIGGLVGAITSESTGNGSFFEESYSLASVASQAHNSYGGLVGGLWYKGEIENCY